MRWDDDRERPRELMDGDVQNGYGIKLKWGRKETLDGDIHPGARRWPTKP
jgi:hypothetical protein